MPEFYESIEKSFAQRGIAITPKQTEQFAIYGEFLVEYNQNVNLTALTSMEDIVQKHFLDSLTALQLPQLKEGATCADIGTGAGFPGVPLAIMRPDLSMLLVDSLKKRLLFLDLLKEKAGIANISTLHTRSEDGGRNPQYREKFDIALSRAVAKLNVLCELNLPFVKGGGFMLAYKGPAAADEIKDAEKAIRVLGGHFESLYKDEKDTQTEHSVVVIKKIRSTPPQYPRQAGTPEKDPL